MPILNADGDANAALDRTGTERSNGLLAVLEGTPGTIEQSQGFSGARMTTLAVCGASAPGSGRADAAGGVRSRDAPAREP